MTRALAALSLVGLAIAGYLTYVHYGEVEPFCTGISDCVRVQSSEYAEIAGVPVALIGLFGYLAILGSLWLAPEVTALLAYIGLGFSAYLTWAELFRIHAICQWCVASALVMTAIAVLATVRTLRAEPRFRHAVADALPPDHP
ncbi:MAG TPA: vitamin K epoxide reductase family protein [Thermoleophilaceae bacterium]